MGYYYGGLIKNYKKLQRIELSSKYGRRKKKNDSKRRSKKSWRCKRRRKKKENWNN